VYEGKAHDPSQFGSTYDTVLRMTQQYQQQHYILFTDNWFTSPTLLDALKAKGMRVCGSVKRNRQGMPPITKAQAKGLQRGEWIQQQKGDTSVAVWKDRKVVWVLYNHISSSETASLERWNDRGEKVSFGCPKAIHDYFYHARSVDIVNQLHYSYLIGRKSKRAWSRLAWWLIDMCIVNAFQLWAIGKTAPRQLHFREELMHALVKLLGSNREAVYASRGANAAIALVKDHYPQHSEQRGNCDVCSHGSRQRTQTRIICAKCGVHLCIGNCFKHYHA
jgi:hypothetical protein